MVWPIIAALGSLLSSAGGAAAAGGTAAAGGAVAGGGASGLMGMFGSLLGGGGGGGAEKFTPEELHILDNYKPMDVRSNLNLGMNPGMYDLSGTVASDKRPEGASIMDYLTSGKMPQVSSSNSFGTMQAKDMSNSSGIDQLMRYVQQQQRNPRVRAQSPVGNAYIQSLLGG